MYGVLGDVIAVPSGCKSHFIHRRGQLLRCEASCTDQHLSHGVREGLHPDNSDLSGDVQLRLTLKDEACLL